MRTIIDCGSEQWLYPVPATSDDQPHDSVCQSYKDLGPGLLTLVLTRKSWPASALGAHNRRN